MSIQDTSWSLKSIYLARTNTFTVCNAGFVSKKAVQSYHHHHEFAMFFQSRPFICLLCLYILLYWLLKYINISTVDALKVFKDKVLHLRGKVLIMLKLAGSCSLLIIVISVTAWFSAKGRSPHTNVKARSLNQSFNFPSSKS